MELLLEFGADPNEPYSLCESQATYGSVYPIQLSMGPCLRQGLTIEITRLLLRHGTDPHLSTARTCSALSLAASTGNTDVVKLLLQYGAAINTQSERFGNALYAAITGYRGSHENVQVLLQHGADANLPGGYYGSAIQAAVVRPSSYSKVSLWIQHGADVNAGGGFYGTAMQSTAARPYPNTMLIRLLF